MLGGKPIQGGIVLIKIGSVFLPLEKAQRKQHPQLIKIASSKALLS